MALSFRLRAFLCLWGQPLSVLDNGGLHLGCHLSLGLQVKWGAISQSMPSPAAKPREEHICYLLCPWHSPLLKFLRGPLGSRCSFSQLHIRVLYIDSRPYQIPESHQLPQPSYLCIQSITSFYKLYFLVISPIHPIATSLPYITIISYLKTAVVS